MKLKSLLALTLAVVSGHVAAADVFHPSNDEPGTVNHVIPGSITRAERVEADRDSGAARDSQWVFLAEEAGWSLRPHGYALREGRVVHDDPFSHDTPKPRLDSIAASAYQALERE